MEQKNLIVENSTKNLVYIAPAIEVIEMEVEGCVMQSSGGITGDGWEGDGGDIEL